MKFFGSRRDAENLLREHSDDPYLVRRMPKDSIDLFVDVGAQAGLVSTQARLKHNKMSIISIEADVVACAMLTDNVAGLNIQVVNMAIGDGTPLRKAAPEERFTKGNEFKADPKGAVHTFRLPDVLQSLHVTNFNSVMFKIDCEGCETCILWHPESEALLQQSQITAFELHRTNKSLAEYGVRLEEIMGKTHTAYSRGWPIDLRSLNGRVINDLQLVRNSYIAIHGLDWMRAW